MIERKSRFILKSYSPDYDNDIAIEYIKLLMDTNRFYLMLLQKAQIIISNLNLDANDELYSYDSSNVIRKEWSTDIYNPFIEEITTLTIIKKLSGHKNVYEIRLDGGHIYPRILFTIYDRQVVMTFGVTKNPETRGTDGVISKIDGMASESELIISAVSGSRSTYKEYLGVGDDIIEIQF